MASIKKLCYSQRIKERKQCLVLNAACACNHAFYPPISFPGKEFCEVRGHESF